MRAARVTRLTWLAWLALVVLCASLFVWTAPGRITYPDDEIVFQTTQSLVEDHDLSIAGIAKRTGERVDRPTGTFGWAPGRDGERYGFFGHGTSIVAIPAYLLARASVEHIPPLWRYAARPDLFYFHRRDLDSDWKRLVVSLTNSLITPLGALLLGLWLSVLGYRPQICLVTALVYALGTTAWPYAGTLLSEPLTTLVLLGAALEISRWHRCAPGEGRGHLWAAATLAGLSVHVHVLNLIALPCLLAYALGPPARRARARAEDRRTWLVALTLGASGLALLGLSQWWRFGSPFETGRFDHYGHWVWPLRGLWTMLVAPGRSLLWYSPPLLLALWAWPKLRARDPSTATFVAALALSRLVFVACRSDWHGGWAIGPRYLIPTIPFVLVALASWLEGWAERPRWGRIAAASVLGLSVPLQAWLASHSVFQLFWRLNIEHGRERYMAVADWRWTETPMVAFWRAQQPALAFWRDGQLRAALNTAQFDALGFGAYRLARATDADGLWQIMLGFALAAILAAVVLVYSLWALSRARGPRRR